MMNFNNHELSISELDAVAGGDSEAHWKIGGFRFGITVTDTPGGQMICTTVKDPSGKTSSSCSGF